MDRYKSCDGGGQQSWLMADGDETTIRALIVPVTAYSSCTQPGIRSMGATSQTTAEHLVKIADHLYISKLLSGVYYLS